jgi:hypothetical protein
MQFRARVLGLTLAAALAVPAAAQVSYVGQTRRVETIPDDDPPPTEITGATSQQASDFGPFNGSLNTTFYWGQEGYDYGGPARVSQNSELTFSGVHASGSLYVEGDTVSVGARSILETTFDLPTVTDYRLAIAYGTAEFGNFPNSVGIDGLVELRRVEAGGDVVVVRREADFATTLPPFETVDAGTLQPGRYELSMVFQARDASDDVRAWSYDVRLVVPEPATGSLGLCSVPLLLRRRRR